MIQISILMIADKLVGEAMKEKQCFIAKRVKYVALPDLQIRAVPRHVVNLIQGVIILTTTGKILSITHIIKNRNEIFEINLLQSRLENVSQPAVAAIYV